MEPFNWRLEGKAMDCNLQFLTPIKGFHFFCQGAVFTSTQENQTETERQPCHHTSTQEHQSDAEENADQNPKNKFGTTNKEDKPLSASTTSTPHKYRRYPPGPPAAKVLILWDRGGNIAHKCKPSDQLPEGLGQQLILQQAIGSTTGGT
ncbi:uncharacterized protein PGTG_03446 [Puccinia graminis f. sp. tritici CRL 75-36-700-3]|uniref:Uncharacterized protein n=1 Tax=Puccinia graminis f. sp. tritici (strain CRL 75-36-700-3 / race SCCL) TaxID=418459 RepID=E3JZL5_PUCGT|nr:uncharacterized protein PGTG_03446 [Puccinia graminis f. sp. tritici CRL 75-36-700-3]EFP77490.1 hypothetical protein PGTG_03446 [Puccinia graminis f. sp. tritici CRL 75-36-700-3]